MKNKKSFTKCAKCGKKKFARQEIIKKRLSKYSSLEECEKNWICRDCKKEIEVKMPKEKIEKEVKKIKEKAHQTFFKQSKKAKPIKSIGLDIEE